MLHEKRFSVREAIATAFCLDFADIENDYRYQPGAMHTPCAVYTIGEGYYTATKSPNVKPKEGNGYLWIPHSTEASYGWQIWVSKKEI